MFLNHIKNFLIINFHIIVGETKNICFVHGGFNRHSTVEENEKACPYIFWWDRDLWFQALSYREMPNKANPDHPNIKYGFKIKNNFDIIFIGHTPTINWNTDKPMNAANIWNIDTGAGFDNGKLTIMNVDNTNEYWQSDLKKDLYPI